MTPDELYQRFVERHLEDGNAEVPADWPEEARARCLFYLKMAGGAGERLEERSVLAVLSGSGVVAGIELEGERSKAPFETPRPPGAGERYVIEREVARGGMGRILLAYDRDFRRRIAVKVSLAAADDARRASRFVEEAQATAQLEHPNIPPVYDLGVDSAGSPYFTMKWIRGRDLKQILATGTGEFSLIRLLQILEQAAMGVHFANTRGVVHRDLKPQNVMVGDFGEVLVVDWGLAKVLGHAEEDPAEAAKPPISTRRRDEGQPTLEGTVQGSLAYMAPEQAWGDAAAIDARTDVFGLGAILYEILTGAPPRRQGSLQAMLEAARFEEVEPPRSRAGQREVPAELEAAARKALALRPEDRYPSAKELHDAVQDYIEGLHDRERRAAEAARLRAEADRLRGELREREAEERASARAESELRAALRTHDAEDEKRPLWEAAARADAGRRAAGEAFQKTAAAYRAVLSIAPADGAARAGLAGLHFEQLREAEARGDATAAELHEGLVRQYDDGGFRVELEGRGLLRLSSEPPGATVFLARYEDRRPLLVEGETEVAGVTPLEKPLPRGSYLVVLRKLGFCAVRYPVFIARCGRVEARVRLRPEGSIPEGFVQVPGGPTIAGGEARDFSRLPRRQVEVPETLVSRFPVTFGEYCEFLAELGGEGEPWKEHAPLAGSTFYVERRPDGRFIPVPRFSPAMPVFAVRAVSADLYCQWLGRRLSRRVRLLREEEWERSARGADGRLYPWGNDFDWALCKGALSRPGEPLPEPVGSFPRDQSPFGVRDLAGGIRELCEETYVEGYRVTRGGSWFNPNALVFRADWRLQMSDAGRSTDVGFRVCYAAEAG